MCCIIKQRLENILSELNISVEHLCCLKNHEIKNLTSIDQNDDLNIRYGKSKILEYLTDLEHVVAVSKNIIEVILLTATKPLGVDSSSVSLALKKSGEGKTIVLKKPVVFTANVVSCRGLIFNVFNFFSVGIVNDKNNSVHTKKICFKTHFQNLMILRSKQKI